MKKIVTLDSIKLTLLNIIDKKPLIRFILGIQFFLLPFTIANFKKLTKEKSLLIILKKVKNLYSIKNTKTKTNIVFDSNKENILFFMHSNGITGTSILSITLLEELKYKYNIFSVSTVEGELTPFISEHTVKNYSYSEFMVYKILFPNFKFAIINSLETYNYLTYTSNKSINSIFLIHEFISQYDKNIVDFVKFKSDHIVFSSKTLINKDHFIIPQLTKNISYFPQCIPTFKLPVSNILHFNFKNKIVITSIGTRCIRKGYDLFLDIASAFKNKNFLFVWVGSTAPTEKLFIEMFNEKIKLNKLSNVLIYDDIGNLDNLYQNSDAILSTARLDPFPNIFFDAVNNNKPYFLFNESSGISEIFEEFGLLNLLSSQYTSTYDLSQIILRYFKNTAKNNKFVKSKYQLIKEKYFISPKSYISKLHQIDMKITKSKLDLINQKNYLESNNIVDHSFSKKNDVPEYWFVKEKLEIDDKYFGWSRGYYNKKVKPGFHQGVYREFYNPDDMQLPIYDYFKKNQPKGKWITNLIDNHYKESNLIKSLKVAMHVHVFYPYLLEEILMKIKINKKLPDLYISTDSADKLFEIKQIISKFKYDGRVNYFKSRNIGRDLSPFLIYFKNKLYKYDIIGHFHTKKSPHIQNYVSSSWRNFLLSNLIGYKKYPMMDKTLSYFLSNPDIGIAYPDDPNEIGWTQNYKKGSELLLKMKVNKIPLNFNFPVGSMFWAKPDAIRQVFNIYNDYSEFDPEPLGIDGNDIHAIERIMGIIPEHNKYKTLLIHNKDIRR